MRKLAVRVALAFVATTTFTFGAEIFPTSSVWQFRRGTSEASSPVAAWRIGESAPAGFTNSPAPFWYGDAYPGGTQIIGMQSNYSCIFLRRPFVVTNVQEIGALRLGAFVDDGFVAWINGTEVLRTNVSAAQPTYQTLASNATEPPPFTTYTLPSPAAYLVSGTNILAIQVLNTSLTSSDLGFDCSLATVIAETNPPVINGISPSPGVVASLTSVTVTFSEAVTGVQADDFLVNGIPPAGLSGGGNSYTFTFAQPLYGGVSITWAVGHGITDVTTPPNAFNATAPGATWQYSLIDTTPPTIANLHPSEGATIREFAEIEVTFSEDVLGVDAADLLIGGQPATNVTQIPGGPFNFRFPPRPAGPVTITWAAGHGITDAAAAPNAFAGGIWTNTVDPNLPMPDLVITEFLAANVSTNGLADEDGEQQDWIELHNRGTNTFNLENWSLSDDPELPGLWTFPARALAPNQFLVVFASGKDRKPANATGRLHTNFKLGNAGEHLGLYSPDSPRALISGYTLYPEQRNDISYGNDSAGSLRYFATPTPGSSNGISTITGVCAPVHVNVSRGHFTLPFDLTLSCATPGAILRYTTDGSEPTQYSPSFPSSLRVSSTTLFRAAAFKSNFLPAKTVTHSYFFNLPTNLRSLPVISLVTASNNLYGPAGILGINGGSYSNGPWQSTAPGDYHNPSKHGLAWERPISAEWIRPEDNSGFQADTGIRVQGSDYQRPRITPTSKVSFRLYFRGDYGPGRLEYPLFPLTGVDRFDQVVLRAGFNEKDNPFIRDEIHRRLSHDMGQVASHGTLAVVFVNGVRYTNSPWYNPCERVHEEFLQEHLGGGADWDVVGPSFAQGAGIPGVVDGDRADFQSMVNYVRTQTVTSQTVYSNIARRLDLTNFVDYCLLNAYAAMGDWPANNWRAGRDRANSLWRFIVWDAEWGMGIYDRTTNINSFTLTGGGPDDSGLGSVNGSEIAQLYDRLRASPEFRLLWADRVQKHFFNGGALTGANITNRFNELRSELLPLIPNMDVEILQWARDRQPGFFSQMNPYGLLASSNAPGFNQFGGRVAAGFNLVITNLTGTIYYTTNGADPRVPFTSAVSPAAIPYAGAVPLNTTVPVRARSLQGTNWSAMTEATFVVGSLGYPLRITEIMYNPPGGSLHEFIELQNTGPTAVDLSGIYFGAVDFMFLEGSSLAGGARLVLGSNTDTNSWKARYPGVAVAGWFGGNLNNGGERITLHDRFGNLITSVDYRDSGGWPTAADGGGRSLTVINPLGDPDAPANWQASIQDNGSPSAVNSPPPVPLVQLNEVMAENLSAFSNGATFPDWIELHNPGASEINVSGWSLSDDGNARKFVFPSDVTIPALGFLTIWCDSTTNTTLGLHAGFSLDRDGESVFLYNAATNRVDALTFGLQLADYSVGRIGGNWTLTTPTPDGANAAAAIGSTTNLVLNEWLANPAPGGSDWVELFNRSLIFPVPLQGVYLGTTNSAQSVNSLSFIAPGGFVQLFADEGVGPDHLDLKLTASGDSLVLYDATASELQRVNFGAQSEAVSQGRLPDGNSNVVNFPGSLSPGTTNYVATWTGPVLNEVLARNRTVSVGGLFVDFIELYNPGATSFNLGGLSLSVNSAEPGEWIFPPGTALGPGAYLLLPCDGSRPSSTNAGSFNLGKSLDGESGGVYLFNKAGQLVNSVEYGLQVDDLPIGLSGSQWRLLGSATPNAANAPAATLGTNTVLRLNEWMADPSDGADWFEIFNPTNRPVDLSGISLTDDPSLIGQDQFRPAPLSFIGPNGFAKWIADANPGEGRNHVNFSLDGAGDSVLIYRVNGASLTLVDAVAFGAQTAGASQGRLPDGAANIVAFPGSPTPGESNYRLLENVVINEVLAHTDPPLEDAIELYNPTATPVNIGGWFLSNSRDNFRKYELPANTTIPAGGFAVIYENQFNDGTADGFTLNSAHGDEVWLSAAMAGVETGDRAVVRFGASFNGVSFGRVLTSAGIDFWSSTQRTFGMDNPATLTQFRSGTGSSNTTPLISPVVINEILYNPAGGGEFVELHNVSASVAPLFDPAYPTNHWKLGGGMDFTFPANFTLVADGYALVVAFDPATNATVLADFCARYGISAGVSVLGPFSGQLNNSGDSVELYRPDTPQQPPSPDAGFVPYVLVDRVNYNDRAPWPVASAEGSELSLQRLGPTLYGNEPLNWLASAPTPGAANNVLVDTDGDGIPDSVELQMGLDPHNPADGAADADGDGATNFQEYFAGTDHLNPGSYLKLDQITFSGGIAVSFFAVSNRTYSVLSTDSLTNLNWSKLADVSAHPTNRVVSVPDNLAPGPARFYRLVTPAVQP